MHNIFNMDKPLIKIYVNHNYFCYYLFYARLHVSTYLSGHHHAFLQLRDAIYVLGSQHVYIIKMLSYWLMHLAWPATNVMENIMMC